ncbi:MAG TPA: LamG-like jellyroll fold domain-containing protein [Candidatus Paceibacterota bacterium]|nr:LamG-like jellyroll fold domain-containing protein [Candidatus Paceibacterota bacterium]
MSSGSPGRKAFTLIELLVVIAIIAILAVVVVLTLNPAELLRQSRDANRVSDMATLVSAVNLYNTDQSGGSGFNLGSPNTVYVSIADPSATSTAGDQCQGLGLVSLPGNYSYHCAASSTYRQVNANGWIPVNFQGITAGTPLSSLPVDPTNNSSSRLYYTYATNGTQFEVTASMESQKYQLGGSGDVISGDGGPLASVYEKGTVGLEPLDAGDNTLLLFWPLNEGTGTVVYDGSGNNATGSLLNAPTWNTSPCKLTSCIYFGSLSPYVKGPSMTMNLNTSAYTYCAWFYVPSSSYSVSDYGDVLLSMGYPTIGIKLGLGSSSISIVAYVNGGAYAAYGTASYNQWHQGCVVFAGFGSSLRTYYFDGAAVGSDTSGSVVSSTANFFIGNNGLSCCGTTSNGPDYLNDIRFYDRALTPAQIAALYSGGK